MRIVILLTMGVLLTLGPSLSAQQSATRITALYKKGLQAMEQGQVDVARACFTEVLRIQPNNPNAKFQLRQLNLRAPSLLAKRRQAQLAQVKLPAVNFDQLTIAEALDALDKLVLKETKEKFAPNFIVQDPDGVLDDRKFSLKLGNLPATVVLKYCLDNVGATARYDQHAIVVRPNKKSASTTDPSTQKTPAKPRGVQDPFGR